MRLLQIQIGSERRLYFRLFAAGLFSVGVEKTETVHGSWELHFLVRPSHWIWGHYTEPYDLCMENYGVGPLMLLCVLN